MEGNNEEVAHEFLPLYRIYKDGRVERLMGTEVVPPSVEDPKTGVSSKDVVIIPKTGVSARLYVTKLIQNKKLPLLVYFHGGGFCIDTAFSPTYHYFLNDVVSQANVVAVSVDYRRAPEHYVPVAFDDSWAALNWVLSHFKGGGSESWLSDYADFDQVFLGGDSAGSTIAHNMEIRSGTNPEQINGVKIFGVAMAHPYFLLHRFNGLMEGPGKLWYSVCPSTTGRNDPLINPTTETNLARLGCDRVLVFVAEKDVLKDIGCVYFETLKNIGWGGVVEIMESQGENHVFHLTNPTCENAVNLMKRFVSFLNINRIRSMP
ncbi:probable carboxylesterase 12 [Papaver somniferum]|uniref:probable carboxylesterase 12 n=1 Tax=Papaver somniferum TaxID=3469 RepID=UPI000E6FE41E|nr:probable carboxylesterase 12 [Papaver somniferum]